VLCDLRTRDASEHVFVEFSIEVDEATPINDAQAVLAAAEQAVLALLPIMPMSSVAVFRPSRAHAQVDDPLRRKVPIAAR